MSEFSMKTQHSVHTYDQISKVKYEQYGLPLKILIVALGLTMILIGALSSFGGLTKSILIVLGGWLLISYNYPFVIMSEKRATAKKFLFPAASYEFESDVVVISEDGAENDILVPYSEIARIIRDELCIYLFLSDRSGHLLLTESMKKEELERFIDFICQKTGLNLKARNSTGIHRAASRWRDNIELLFSKNPRLVPLVENARERRIAKQEAYEQEAAEKAEEESIAAEKNAEMLEKEQRLHEELKANPAKMEEFKKSVRKGKK